MSGPSGAPRPKITYATLRADNEDLHAGFEAALAEVRADLGATHLQWVAGSERAGAGWDEMRAPADDRIVLGRFARGTPDDVADAVAAARAAQPAWAALGWPERVAILRRAAEAISERLMPISAAMSLEVGKNRIEALGETEEAADLIRYYAAIAEENRWYVRPMGNLGDAATRTRSVLRPHGVFAVISPFNFPLALSAGPVAAALMAGNTVVLKPSRQGAWSAVLLARVLRDAGLPHGVFHLVLGPGETVGAALTAHPGIDGVVFTGSYAVGMDLFRGFARRWPRPCIVEMGGKNPAIVMGSADLDMAAEGIVRSAFGFGGQKCSANSRVYVERRVHDALVARIAERAAALTIGDPAERATFLGPVIDGRAAERFTAAVADARRAGRVVTGGERWTDGIGAHGAYVRPTVVAGLPPEHRLFAEELFLPFLAVAPVDSLAEALARANASELGLTAGIYTGDAAEVETFLDGVEAGVLYVNRRAGATTGAWPGIQPFGGWKGSGSTGKSALGPHYVAQFLREQSHTIVG